MPHLRGLGVSEPGMADHQFIRYLDGAIIEAMVANGGRLLKIVLKAPASETLWVEFKKRGGKAEQHQKDWHTMERARGALVWVMGEDFEASIESFCKFYAASGLQRKSISIPR